MVAGRQVLRWDVEEGFTWLTQADDISVTTAGSWQDIDRSSYVPSNAAGVVVELINTDNATHRAFVRGKEDTRDYMSGPQDGRLRNRTHRWQMVKLDSNRNDTGLRQRHLRQVQAPGIHYGGRSRLLCGGSRHHTRNDLGLDYGRRVLSSRRHGRRRDPPGLLGV